MAVVFCVSPGTVIVACPFLIVPLYVLPLIVVVTFPVASFKPVTTMIASSPAVIGSAVAVIVRFSF